MSVENESPQDESGCKEFVTLFDRVYEDLPVRWAADTDMCLPVVMGEGGCPDAVHRARKSHIDGMNRPAATPRGSRYAPSRSVDLVTL